MSDTESFDALMARLRSGDDDAAAAVFRRFSHRLIALARAELRSMSQARGDVEDVVQSAYKSFFSRYGQGRFQFDDWEDLWSLLTTITLRKCSNRRTYHRARRRNPPPGSATVSAGSSVDLALELIDREPSPLEAAALADTVRELFRGLDEPHRETVCLLLQGYSSDEIASALACSERTVRRMRSRLKERLKELDTA